MRSPDWFAVLTELIYAGVTMRQIARELDGATTESLLRYYRSGGEPLYVRGEALLRLWSAKTGKAIADVPRKEYPRGHRVRVAPKQRRV